MAITVRALASERSLSEVSRVTRAQETSFRKVSSGQRVQRGVDDPAALATAMNLATRQRSYEVAARNGHSAMAMVDMVEQGSTSLEDLLVRLRELAVRGSSGLVTTTEQTALHEEAQNVVASVDDVATGTRWGETSLLDAARTLRVKVSIDHDATQDISLQLHDLTSTGLGVDRIDLRTQASAQTGIATVDAAMDTLHRARADLAAFQNRLEHTLNLLDELRVRNEDAIARVRDLDLGAEVATLVRHQVLASAGIAVAMQARTLPRDVLSLLRGSPSAPRKAASSPRSAPAHQRIVPTGNTTPRATVARARATPVSTSTTSGWRRLYAPVDDETPTTTGDTRTTPSDTEKTAAPWARVVGADDVEAGGFVALSVSLSDT